MRKRLLNFLLLLASVCAYAQPGTLDPTFNPNDAGLGIGDGINGPVRATAVQPDGKILVGGWFELYDGASRPRIVRLKADGTLDASFNPGYGVSGIISSIVVQPDGKILIGGAFLYYHTTRQPAIARLNADGTLDATFTSGLNESSSVNTISLQTDGKIVIGGNFTNYSGTPQVDIARLNPDGSLDAGFNAGTGTNAFVHTTAVQPDGKILIGGNFTAYNGTPCSRLARLNTDGTLDMTFNTGGGGVGSDEVFTIATLSDGKILIGGTFTYYNLIPRNGIARLNADGTLDASFGTMTGAYGVRTLTLQNDGKIVIGGYFTAYNGTNRNRIARLNADGTLDVSFDPGTGTEGNVYSVAIQSDDKILIGGEFLTYNGVARLYVNRLNSNGTQDQGFYNFTSTGAQGPIFAMAVQPSGKILIAGDFLLYNGIPQRYLARLNADGSFDPTFNRTGTGPDDLIYAMATQPDGKILIGGNFSIYNGFSRSYIARLHADGSIDPTFNSSYGASGTVSSIAIQPDGKILIGGAFSSYNGVSRSRLARLNADGSLDATFNTATGANGSIQALALQTDGKIIIGGDFTTYKSIASNRIARLNTDGSLDASFDPGSGADNRVESITLLHDGKLLIGGGFLRFNGTVRGGIARLNVNGQVDPSFNMDGTGVNGTVHATVIQPDGKILISGGFSFYDLISRNSIARLDVNGVLDSTFNSGSSPVSAIEAMALLPNNDILIAGRFTSYNNIGRNRIARLYGGTFSIGAASPTAYCQGGAITIPITTTGGYKVGNVFMAQMSDAAGSFTSPITLGTLSSTTSGSITGTIPANTPAGTGYKIRVMVEDAGVVQIDPSISLTIKAIPAAPVVTANTPTTFCLGRNVILNSSATTGNQWYKDGVAIDNAIEQIYTAHQSGSYTTVATVNGCSSPASIAKAIAVTPTPEKPTITRTGNTLTASTAASYQWYLNGEVLPEATLQSYAVQASGVYTVQVTQSGCTANASAEPYNFVATALPTTAAWNGEVIAFPNPTIKTLYLRNTAHRKLAIQLVDVAGKVFYKATIAAASASIDMSGFANGVYRLVVTDISKQETITLSILKQ